MGSLDEHFGENAELDQDTVKQLIGYLSEYAADKSTSRRSARIVQSLAGESPLRITLVP